LFLLRETQDPPTTDEDGESGGKSFHCLRVRTELNQVLHDKPEKTKPGNFTLKL
jgi:hypothetical protein